MTGKLIAGTATKICVICGKVFAKPANVYGQAWAKRRTCCRDCGAVLRWNNTGRKPRAKCRTCGKPVPKHGMKYCCLECRVVLRQCEWCGKMVRMRKHERYCSRKCSGEAHQTPAERRVCMQCGKSFAYKPNQSTKGMFCSNGCSARYNQDNGIIPSPLDERQIAARIAGVRASPLSGPFVTNHGADEWFLISPQEEHLQIHNLKLFIRDQSYRFTEYELAQFPSGKQQRIYSGLAGLKPGNTRKRIPTVYHGWRWWRQGQAKWDGAIREIDSKDVRNIQEDE